MTLQRILVVLSAILLVGAVAIATVVPPSMPLGEALYLLDEGLTQHLHEIIAGYLSGWAWANLAVPLLLRPAWLVPASLGVICAGAAVSVSNRKATRRTHHRSQ